MPSRLSSRCFAPTACPSHGTANGTKSSGATRPPDRDGHIPLHGHRGLDAAVPGARRCLRRRCSPSTRALARAWRRHAGSRSTRWRRVLRRLHPRVRMPWLLRARRRRALAAGPVRVRMGLHTGEPRQGAGGYVGLDVHRAARIAAAGHGGQVLLSQATADLAGRRGARPRPAPAEGSERAGAAVPARSRAVPAPEDVARDESAGSRDAVSRP